MKIREAIAAAMVDVFVEREVNPQLILEADAPRAVSFVCEQSDSSTS